MPSDLPAMLGGTPVRPQGPPAWPIPDPDVQAALTAAVATGSWGQYHGEHVCALEAELAAFHDVPHAITCASGTLAVEAALRALRVGPGDEVVLAAYDYESNFLTVHALGAKPVLVDVHPANWQLDPAKLEAAFSPQTKAVICSHLHGGIVPMREVMAIARKHGIGVVEDAAQAPGATVEGKPAGTWGDVGTLSFGGSKLLTAGRGGGVLFNDAQLYQRAKTWLHRGLQQWAPLSELQAAALRPQVRKLKEATRLRAERVRELLELLSDLTPPAPFPSDLTPPAPFPKAEGGAKSPTGLCPSRFSGRGSEASGEGSKNNLTPPAPFPEKEGGARVDPSLVGRAEGSSVFCPSLFWGGRGSEASGEGSASDLPSFPALLPFAPPHSSPAYYKLGFQYDAALFGLAREVFVKALRAEGIAFDAGFRALHVGRSPSRFRVAGELTHATDAHERCVMLHHPVLSGATADVRQVADAVAKVYRYRDELTRFACSHG